MASTAQQTGGEGADFYSDNVWIWQQYRDDLLGLWWLGTLEEGLSNLENPEGQRIFTIYFFALTDFDLYDLDFYFDFSGERHLLLLRQERPHGEGIPEEGT